MSARTVGNGDARKTVFVILTAIVPSPHDQSVIGKGKSVIERDLVGDDDVVYRQVLLFNLHQDFLVRFVYWDHAPVHLADDFAHCQCRRVIRLLESSQRTLLMYCIFSTRLVSILGVPYWVVQDWI